MYPGSLESQLYPELCKMKCHQQFWQVVLLPLFCPRDTSPAVLHSLLQSGAGCKKDMDLLELVQRTVMKTDAGILLLQRQAEMLHGRLWGRVSCGL